MAQHFPTSASINGGQAAFETTETGGDDIFVDGGDLLIEFRNRHSSPITVTFAPVKTTVFIIDTGMTPVPIRQIAVPASGDAAFAFRRKYMGAYIGAQGFIRASYSGWDDDLRIRVLTSGANASMDAASWADELAPPGYHWEFVFDDQDATLVRDDETNEPVVGLTEN